MAIENRNFKGGERLVSTGKKYAGRTVDVVKGKDGLVYRLDDGREFTSISSAGMAVRDGKATNGFAFFSLATEAPPPKATAKKAPAAKSKKASAKKTAPATKPAAETASA
jgi:leucyl aminopeptidase (aminopeptidase T)